MGEEENKSFEHFTSIFNSAILDTALHLLRRSTSGSAGVGLVRSSKLMMKSDISSTSDRIGAITSEQRNFCPEMELILF